MDTKKNIILVSFILLIVIVTTALIYYTGLYIDVLYKCKQKRILADVDIDNSSEDFAHIGFSDYKNIIRNKKKLVLENNHFKILDEKTNKLLWESDKRFKVKDFIYCDIDRDNKNEILLVLWKKGIFGKYMPFFAHDNKSLWSQHLFIYDIDSTCLKPIWCSSYFSVIIDDISFDDKYKILSVIDTNKGRTRFIWQTWGLDSIDASKFDFDTNNDKIEVDFKINAFGDNLIHHQIYEYGLNQNNKSFDYLYENIKKELDGDINAINQETMFIDKNEGYSEFPNFGTPIEVGDALINAGFNLITLANNHTLDRKNKAVITTYNYYDNINNLSNNKINFIGISNNENEKIPYKIIKKGNLKISIFNYTYNVNSNRHINFEKKLPFVNDLRDERQVKRDLDEGIRKSDLSIVFVHWGTEYKNEIDSFQRKWAEIFLKAGVDIVIGTHPHVLQKHKVLKDSLGNEMLIYYSLGNYISFQKGIDRLVGGEAKIEIALTNHGLKIINYDLKKTITHKQGKYTTTYMLEDYDQNLALLHNDRVEVMELFNRN